MMAFRQIAPLILNQFGGSRMIIIYTLSGMAGFWTSCLAGVPLTIGASAAICGLMGAALYYGKSRGGVYGRTVFRQIGNWAVALMPFSDSWFPESTTGDMAAAWFPARSAGRFWDTGKNPRQNTLHHLAAGILVLATAGVLLWAVFSGFVAAYGFSGFEMDVVHDICRRIPFRGNDFRFRPHQKSCNFFGQLFVRKLSGNNGVAGAGGRAGRRIPCTGPPGLRPGKPQRKWPRMGKRPYRSGSPNTWRD